MGGGGVSGRASLALPESGVEVVPIADRCPLPDVKGLNQCFQLEQAPSQFQIGVGDGAVGVGIADEAAGDALGPLVPPHHGYVGLPALPRLESVAGEPHSSD